MKIANQCVVTFHYELTDDGGQTLDSSEGRDPLVYLHGAAGIIPGLEAALEGREPGDSFRATIPPEDAYGNVVPELMQEVPLDALANIDNLTEGMMLQAQGADGRVQHLKVESIGAETATLNANHPLAGQILHFDVTIESVREATAEEISHGHAH